MRVSQLLHSMDKDDLTIVTIAPVKDIGVYALFERR